MSGKTALVIGSGFSGLSAACVLAKNGFNVTVLEKNTCVGGRARKFTDRGFTFDMGPSWYWMPDIFESFFNYFGKKTSDFYHLKRLDPSYRIIFERNQAVDIPASYDRYKDLIENLEKGSGTKLDKFISQAEYKYKVGINDFVYRPNRAISEYLSLKLLLDALRLRVFQSFESHISKYFSDSRVKMMMEFPILFLGALAKNTPALYSLMNYADIKLGTWYPEGGMYKIIEALERLAKELGVVIKTAREVTELEISNRTISRVICHDDEFYSSDVVVASADYHHVEKNLLPEKYRSYSEKYWDKRVLAPSSLIFYLGIDKKIKKLLHHNLFFDADFSKHSNEIYVTPNWPENPLFYVCAPSVTDHTVAPKGKENLFILMPVAPGIKDSEEIRERYFKIIMDRIEKYAGENISDFIIYKRSYAHNDFVKDYHAYKGNAYGLANTLKQTAFLKPKIKSKHLNNLYFTGQLTVPGPGVPPSLISGRVVANEVIKDFA